MHKRPLILIVIGALLLLAGGFLHLTGGPPAADPVVARQCQERMQDQGAAMLARCDSTAFAAAMTATDASAAARTISAANDREVGGNALAMFLLGIGVVLVLGGIVAARRRPGRV